MTKTTERTTADLVRLPALPKASSGARARTNACACGCGILTGSTFAPGHDARLRGWMLRLERGIVKAADIPDGERQAAVAALKAAGGHVDVHARPADLVRGIAPTAPKGHDRKAAKKAKREAAKAEQITEQLNATE